MAEREPQLIVATGTRGVGKTFTSSKMIEQYLTPNPATGKRARKILIFDVNMEYANAELIKNGHRYRTKILALEDLPKWTQQKRIEVRRILPVDANGAPVGVDKMPEILNIILHFFRNGMLVLEDINRYLVETKDAHIIGALATNRHKDLDILIHLQSLSPVTTRMWQNLNCVRFHYQNDSVDRIKNRIPNHELFSVAQCLVNQKYMGGDKRFYCWVMVQENKIHGRFSAQDFKAACEEYLTLNPRAINMTSKKHGTGYYARQEAIKECTKELFLKYYGNRKPAVATSAEPQSNQIVPQQQYQEPAKPQAWQPQAMPNQFKPQPQT